MTDFLESAKPLNLCFPIPGLPPYLNNQKEDGCMSLDTFNLKLEDIFIWSQRIGHKYKTSSWRNYECYGLSNYLINQNDFLF